MKWKIFCILGILAFAPCAVMWAVADDDIDEEEEYEDEEDYDEEDDSEIPSGEGRVVARLTCDTVRAKISELQVQVEANPDLQDELDDMLKKQRSLCARSSGARRVRNFNNRVPQLDVEEVVEEEPEQEEKPKKKKKKKEVKEVEVEEISTEPVKSQKEIDAELASNLAKGLCPDGAKPNKFGCCDGEKFKDLGNLKFACCSKEDESKCHNPINK